MGTVNKLFSDRNRRSLGLEPVGVTRVTVMLKIIREHWRQVSFIAASLPPYNAP